jgi:hypothetical protein
VPCVFNGIAKIFHDKFLKYLRVTILCKVLTISKIFELYTIKNAPRNIRFRPNQIS